MGSSGHSYSRPSPFDLLLCFISPLQQNFSKEIEREREREAMRAETRRKKQRKRQN
ncbi:hypothetical protein CMV_011428, partial [Castanea mollissima]